MLMVLAPAEEVESTGNGNEPSEPAAKKQKTLKGEDNTDADNTAGKSIQSQKNPKQQSINQPVANTEHSYPPQDIYRPYQSRPK